MPNMSAFKNLYEIAITASTLYISSFHLFAICPYIVHILAWNIEFVVPTMHFLTTYISLTDDIRSPDGSLLCYRNKFLLILSVRKWIALFFCYGFTSKLRNGLPWNLHICYLGYGDKHRIHFILKECAVWELWVKTSNLYYVLYWATQWESNTEVHFETLSKDIRFRIP